MEQKEIPVCDKCSVPMIFVKRDISRLIEVRNEWGEIACLVYKCKDCGSKKAIGDGFTPRDSFTRE